MKQRSLSRLLCLCLANSLLACNVKASLRASPYWMTRTNQHASLEEMCVSTPEALPCEFAYNLQHPRWIFLKFYVFSALTWFWIDVHLTNDTVAINNTGLHIVRQCTFVRLIFHMTVKNIFDLVYVWSTCMLCEDIHSRSSSGRANPLPIKSS